MFEGLAPTELVVAIADSQRSKPLTVLTIASPTDMKPRSNFHFADHYGDATAERCHSPGTPFSS